MAYVLEVDWDNDGNYSGVGEDITADVLSVECHRGRDFASQLVGRSTAGQLRAELVNSTGKYSPFNTSGPLYGNLVPGRKVRLRSTTPETTVRLLPTGPGTAADWAPSTGVNWQNVDDDPSDDDTTYNSSSTLNAIDSFAKAPHGLSAAWVAITQIAVTGRFRRTATGGAPAVISIGLDDGSFAGGHLMQTSFELADNTQYQVLTNWWTTDYSGRPWTLATADLARVNYQISQAPGAGAIRATQIYVEITYVPVLWTGYIDRIEPRTVLGPVARATLYAAGPLVRLTGQRVNPAASSGALTGSLVTVVMQAAGLDDDDYDIDPGVSTTSRWFIEDKDALEAVRELEETDLGFLYEHPDGRLRFEDRHARLTESRSQTSQATFSDDPAASLRYREIVEADPLRQIFNEAVATVTPYSVGGLTVLWTYSGSSPVLAPGQSQTFIAQYPNDSSGGAQGAYVDAWTTPDISDITVTGAAFGNLGISVVKSARRMEITITNNHASASATLTLLRARGTPVTKGNPTSVKASDATSQAAYGRRSYTLPGPWLASVNDAQAFVDYVVSRYKDPLAVVSIGIPTSKGAAYLEQAVTRQISDRITLEADSMGIAADFFIEAIAHRITNGGLRHETTFELSPTEGDSGYWVLGTSLLGTDTRLAY